MPLWPNLEMFAQPFSYIGLPVATVPIFAPGAMPVGAQLIYPPWREDLCLRTAADLGGRRASRRRALPSGGLRLRRLRGRLDRLAAMSQEAGSL